jgi:hypothetical protein
MCKGHFLFGFRTKDRVLLTIYYASTIFYRQHAWFYDYLHSHLWYENVVFFKFFGWLYILCNSAAPERPAHGTRPFQVATCLGTHRDRLGWGRGGWFEPATVAFLSDRLPQSHLTPRNHAPHLQIGATRILKWIIGPWGWDHMITSGRRHPPQLEILPTVTTYVVQILSLQKKMGLSRLPFRLLTNSLYEYESVRVVGGGWGRGGVGEEGVGEAKKIGLGQKCIDNFCHGG